MIHLIYTYLKDPHMIIIRFTFSHEGVYGLSLNAENMSIQTDFVLFITF